MEESKLENVIHINKESVCGAIEHGGLRRDVQEGISYITAEEFSHLRDENKVSFETAPSIGDTYIRDQYMPNFYIKVDDNLTINTIKSSFYAMTDVARLLGAKKISHNIKFVREEKREWDNNSKVACKGVEIDANVKSEKESELRKQLHDRSKYLGESRIPTQKEYEEAKARAKELGVDNNLELKSLIEQRDPTKSSGLIKEREITETVTQTMNSELDIAFGLTAGKSNKMFNLSNSFTKTVSVKETISQHIIIEF
jgi:cold shock CspA family protein